MNPINCPPVPPLKDEPAFIGEIVIPKWMTESPRYKDLHEFGTVCRAWDYSTEEPDTWHFSHASFPTQQRAEQSAKDIGAKVQAVSHDRGETWEFSVWRWAAAKLVKP